MTYEIGREAFDKRKGMTLGELKTFVEDAERAEMPIDSVLWVSIGWHSNLQIVRVKSSR